MATKSKNLGSQPVFPPGVNKFIKRRCLELLGLIFLSLSGAMLLALISFDPRDASLNTVNSFEPRNTLGAFGATFADLALQTLGLSILIFTFTVAIFGWKLLRHISLSRIWLRLLCLIASIIAISIGAASIPKFDNWPLVTGYGGAVGDFSLLRSKEFLATYIEINSGLVGAAGFLMGFAFFVGAGGATAMELRTLASSIGRYFKWTGKSLLFIYRTLLKFKAHPTRQRDQNLSERREPSLMIDDGFGPSHISPVDENILDLTQPMESEQKLIEPRNQKLKSGKREIQARQRKLDLGLGEGFDLPPLELLRSYASIDADLADDEALSKNAKLLESVLSDYGVQGEVTRVRPGPVVTLYEFEPAPGVKSSRVIGLADDIARSMAAMSVRVAVIPGKNVMGVELPNAQREVVSLREILASKDYEKPGLQLTLGLGKDIGGSPVISDLARMPHLLIAGTTGSGKSVAINTMILSILYRLSPEKCRFVMIDPKMLELSVYDGIPHLLSPVVTDPKKAVVALRWTVREMEDRYRAMSTIGVRNIASFNARIQEAKKKKETLTRNVHTGFDPKTGEPLYEDQPLNMDPLPYIIVVVDEMADLMLVAGKEVEASVQRIAQMARAAGIHLIMATQRPSVDVITGTIKANFPTRVSFQVTSKIDSRTILGESGAEQLLGQGDMLYMAAGAKLTRVHGPLVTDEEVEAVVAHIKAQAKPDYLDAVTSDETESNFTSMTGFIGPVGDDQSKKDNEDNLYDQAVAVVCRDRKASTSYIQRRLQIGYNRAARLIDRMEEEGVISSANHVGKRQVLARNIDDRSK